MTSSSKSKSLRVERLENRELMASYVGFVEAAELEKMELLSRNREGEYGADWAKPSRGGMGADLEYFSNARHSLPRDFRGRTSQDAFHDRVSNNSVWIVNVPVVPQVIVVVSGRQSFPELTNTPARPPILSPATAHRLQPTNATNGVSQEVAEGEAPHDRVGSPMGMGGSVATQSTQMNRPNDVRPPGFFGETDESSNASDEYSDLETEGSNHIDFNSEREASDEIRSDRRTIEDKYFAQLGGSLEEANQDKSLDDAYLDLFVFPNDSSTKFSYEDRLRSKSSRDIEMNWDYLVSSVYSDDLSQNELPAAKVNSLFEVYDPSRMEMAGSELSCYQATKFCKDTTERTSERVEEESDFADSRYWVLGFAFASAWLGMQHRKSLSSKWLANLDVIARFPNYFKRNSDKR